MAEAEKGAVSWLVFMLGDKMGDNYGIKRFPIAFTEVLFGCVVIDAHKPKTYICFANAKPCF